MYYISFSLLLSHRLFQLIAILSLSLSSFNEKRTSRCVITTTIAIRVPPAVDGLCEQIRSNVRVDNLGSVDGGQIRLNARAKISVSSSLSTCRAKPGVPLLSPFSSFFFQTDTSFSFHFSLSLFLQPSQAKSKMHGAQEANKLASDTLFSQLIERAGGARGVDGCYIVELSRLPFSPPPPQGKSNLAESLSPEAELRGKGISSRSNRNLNAIVKRTRSRCRTRSSSERLIGFIVESEQRTYAYRESSQTETRTIASDTK